MLHHFVSNGDTQLVLVPTTDTERVLLKSLLSGEIEVAHIQDHLSILDQNLNGGIIIRQRKAAVIKAISDSNCIEKTATGSGCEP